MSIKEAYEYWYKTARLVFDYYLSKYGLKIALEKMASYQTHASAKYQVRREQGDPTWRYDYARYAAYRSLNTRLKAI